MNKTVKRYLISSGVTFVTGFLVAIVPLLEDLSPELFTASVVIGIILAGARAGIKAVSEYLLRQTADAVEN